MEVRPRVSYVVGMVTPVSFHTPPRPSNRHSTVVERTARIEREEAIIAKGEADIDAGLGIEDDVAEAWLNALDGDPHAALPLPSNGRPIR